MSKYQVLIKEFPEQALEIQYTILRNNDFAAICDDYLACLSAIEHWKIAPDPKGRQEEYQRLLTEIKAEIIGVLLKA